MKNLNNITRTIEKGNLTIHSFIDLIKLQSGKVFRKSAYFVVAIGVMCISLTSCCWGPYGEHEHGEHHHGHGGHDRYLNYVRPSHR